MMMAEPKRRNDGFLHLKCEAVDGGGCADLDAKKLKSGCGRGSVSIRERKDKIGEKVAALQRLVSPFGKTDTASVLLEATGYIKFLHEQLEVLSAPYLQTRPPPRTGNSQAMMELQSLRSRGLCLVPLEYTLRLGNSNGADIWAPANTKNTRF